MSHISVYSPVTRRIAVKTGKRVKVLERTKGSRVNILRPVAGAQGPLGNAFSPIVVGFSFGDASPVVLYTLPQASYVGNVTLDIQTPFNGVGAVLSVGVGGDLQALLPLGHNDPSQALQYETSPGVFLPGGTQLLLAITPGTGATQGSGAVVIDLLKA